MPEPKQPHLNGAYYGPSIPPPSEPRRTYHSHGRGGSGGCNPFCCCCNCIAGCICNCLISILVTIVVVLGIVALILWLLFRPNAVKFYATDARIARFDYSPSNSTLFHDMAINMTIRNPNRRLGIYYDAVEVGAFYGGQRFATNTLSPFYQGHKNTTDLSTEFRGQKIILLGASEVRDYDSQKAAGRYDIDVKLYLRVRFRWGIVRSWTFKPKIRCDLNIPANSNSGAFETTRCHFDW